MLSGNLILIFFICFCRGLILKIVLPIPLTYVDIAENSILVNKKLNIDSIVSLSLMRYLEELKMIQNYFQLLEELQLQKLKKIAM